MAYEPKLTVYSLDGAAVSTAGHVLHSAGLHLVRVRNVPELRRFLRAGATIIGAGVLILRITNTKLSDCRGWLCANCEVMA